MKSINMDAKLKTLLALATLMCVQVLEIVPGYSPMATKAVQLLTYNESSKMFGLNPDALHLMRALTQPMQVISAVGDARVGKSTSMNIVRHIWSKACSKDFVEVFQTGGTMEAVTRGVWISGIRTNGSFDKVLLDVEGTDLGNDAVTDHLSMFTALMSSGMAFFIRDAVKTHAIDFLYRVSRLSDTIFKEEAVKNFPKLSVVLRGALEVPNGQNISDYVKDQLVNPNMNDSAQGKRKAIGKHFPRDSIQVSEIESLQNRKLFQDFEQLLKNEYMHSVENLAQEFKQFPVKKSLNGALIDGLTLVELAGKLVDTMNNDTWEDFGNAYLMVEKHLCDRRYMEIVQPQVNGNSKSLKDFLATGFAKYEKECALEEYVQATKEELTRIANNKEQLEIKQRELGEETQRRKEEEEKRRQAEADFEKAKENMSEELEKIREQREKAEEEAKARNEQFSREMEILREKEREARERLRKLQSDDGFFSILGKILKTVVKALGF